MNTGSKIYGRNGVVLNAYSKQGNLLESKATLFDDIGLKVVA